MERDKESKNEPFSSISEVKMMNENKRDSNSTDKLKNAKTMMSVID